MDPVTNTAPVAAPANRGIVVRDRLTLDSPRPNVDFLYSPFKNGQSVLGTSQGAGQRVNYPIPPNMRVAMGLPMQHRLNKAV